MKKAGKREIGRERETETETGADLLKNREQQQCRKWGVGLFRAAGQAGGLVR